MSHLVRPLSPDEVQSSRDLYGTNTLPAKLTISFFQRWCGSLGDPLVKILSFACIIILILATIGYASHFEWLGILASILAATMIATISEHSNEESFIKLQQEQTDSATLLCYRAETQVFPCHESADCEGLGPVVANGTQLPCRCTNPYTCRLAADTLPEHQRPAHQSASGRHLKAPGILASLSNQLLEIIPTLADTKTKTVGKRHYESLVASENDQDDIEADNFETNPRSMRNSSQIQDGNEQQTRLGGSGHDDFGQQTHLHQQHPNQSSIDHDSPDQVAAAVSKLLLNGNMLNLNVRDCVVGDLIVLGQGDAIPADGILISGHLASNQATLTGEDIGIDKIPVSVDVLERILSTLRSNSRWSQGLQDVYNHNNVSVSVGGDLNFANRSRFEDHGGRELGQNGRNDHNSSSFSGGNSNTSSSNNSFPRHKNSSGSHLDSNSSVRSNWDQFSAGDGPDLNNNNTSGSNNNNSKNNDNRNNHSHHSSFHPTSSANSSFRSNSSQLTSGSDGTFVDLGRFSDLSTTLLNFESPNALFSSTLVEEGSGIMLVLAVGKDTLYGKTMLLEVANGVDDDDDDDNNNHEASKPNYDQFSQQPDHEVPKPKPKRATVKKTPPLIKKLGQFADDISYWAYRAALVIALFNLFQSVVIKNEYEPSQIIHYFKDPVRFFRDIVQSLMLSVIMCVVSIPEGLPASVALVLSLNMGRLLQQKVLVRKLVGISTSGWVTTCFIDKSGSLTRGQFQVQSAITLNQTQTDQKDQNDQNCQHLVDATDPTITHPKVHNQGAASEFNLVQLFQGRNESTTHDNNSKSVHQSNSVPLDPSKLPKEIQDYSKTETTRRERESEAQQILLENFTLFCLRHSSGKAALKNTQQTNDGSTIGPDLSNMSHGSLNSDRTHDEMAVEIHPNQTGKKSKHSSQSNQKEHNDTNNSSSFSSSSNIHSVPTNQSHISKNMDSYDISGLVLDDEDDDSVVGGNGTDRSVLRYVTRLTSSSNQSLGHGDATINQRYETFHTLYESASVLEEVPFSSARKYAMRKVTLSTPFFQALNHTEQQPQLNHSAQNKDGKDTTGFVSKEGHFDPFLLIEGNHSKTTNPRSSAYQTLDASHTNNQMWVIKGAPEMILDKCTHYYTEVCNSNHHSSSLTKQPITPDHVDHLHKYIKAMASNGCRVIAIATATVDPNSHSHPHSHSHSQSSPQSSTTSSISVPLPPVLTLVTILIISDQIRNSTLPSVILMHHAGIRAVMISGDNISTCIYIAKVSGLANPEHLIQHHKRRKRLVEKHGEERAEAILADEAKNGHSTPQNDICNIDEYIPKPIVKQLIAAQQQLSSPTAELNIEKNDPKGKSLLVSDVPNSYSILSTSHLPLSPSNQSQLSVHSNPNSVTTAVSAPSLAQDQNINHLLNWGSMTNFSNSVGIPFNLHFLPLLIHTIAHQFRNIALTSYHIGLLSLVDIYLLMPKLVVVARSLPQDKLKMVIASQLGHDLLVKGRDHHRSCQHGNDNTGQPGQGKDKDNSNIINIASQDFTLNGNAAYHFEIHQDGTVITHYYLGRWIPYHRLSYDNLAILFNYRNYSIKELITPQTSNIESPHTSSPSLPQPHPNFEQIALGQLSIPPIPNNNQASTTDDIPFPILTNPSLLSPTAATTTATTTTITTTQFPTTKPRLLSPIGASVTDGPHTHTMRDRNQSLASLNPILSNPALAKPVVAPTYLYQSEPQITVKLPHEVIKPKPLKSRHLRTMVSSFTGDGSNDVMSMTQAHVAFSLAKSGTPSAQAASDILLLRDSLLCIVSATWYGRALYNNIRNFVCFQLSANLGICTLLIIAPFIHVEWPLTLGQLLFLNVVIDSVTSTALSAEPPSLSLMAQPPLHPNATLLNTRMKVSIFANGAYICLLSIFFLWAPWVAQIFTPQFGAVFGPTQETLRLALGEDEWVKLSMDTFLTGFFTFFISLCAFHSLNVRTLRVNVFKNITKSPFFIYSIPILIFVLYLFTITPLFRSFLRTVPMTLLQWIVMLLFALSICVFEMFRKIATIYFFQSHPEVARPQFLHNRKKQKQLDQHHRALEKMKQAISIAANVATSSLGGVTTTATINIDHGQIGDKDDLELDGDSSDNNPIGSDNVPDSPQQQQQQSQSLEGNYRNSNRIAKNTATPSSLTSSPTASTHSSQAQSQFTSDPSFYVPALPPSIESLLELIHADDKPDQPIELGWSLFDLVEQFQGEIVAQDNDNAHLLDKI